jgi:hypothetical protein
MATVWGNPLDRVSRRLAAIFIDALSPHGAMMLYNIKVN